MLHVPFRKPVSPKPQAYLHAKLQLPWIKSKVGIHKCSQQLQAWDKTENITLGLCAPPR